METTIDYAKLKDSLTQKDATSELQNQSQKSISNNHDENRVVILSKIFGLISWAFEKTER